ncbi:olfactory receptor 11A1-like [Lissotriton helveticus]
MTGLIKLECLDNATTYTQFLLIGFQVLPWIEPLLFLIFLTIYMLTITSNALIIGTVSVSGNLHSPMYFFLANLSCLEVWYTSCIVPTILGGLSTQALTIPFDGCLLQFFVFCWLTTTECFLISAMAYDRYVAICRPLHYKRIMDWHVCFEMASVTWAAGLMGSAITVFLMCQLRFPHTGKIDHFFCDLLPLIKAACSDTNRIRMEAFVFAIMVLSLPCLLVIVSYVHIITAILRIPSTSGRRTAFSTCSSHLIVVITYFGILILVYMVPTADHFLNLNKALSLLYTVGTPVFNPIVYTLRNRQFRKAFKKLLVRE